MSILSGTISPGALVGQHLQCPRIDFEYEFDPGKFLETTKYFDPQKSYTKKYQVFEMNEVELPK